MARRIKVSNRRQDRLARLLPESLQAFLARRVIDGTGLAFAFLGLSILAALLSYDPADPSWNTAPAGAGIANWLGAPGAYTADILIQTLGAAAAVFGLVPLVWGLRLLRRAPISPLWLRSVAMIAAAILAAPALARLPSGGFLDGPYMGGSGGLLLLDQASSLLLAASAAHSHTLAALACGILALMSLAYALALPASSWAFLALLVWRSAAYACALSMALAARFYGWVRHYGDADYEAPPRPALPVFDLGHFLRRKNELQLEEDEDEAQDPEDSFDDAPARQPRQKQAPRISPSLGGDAAHARAARPAQRKLNLEDEADEDWEYPSVDLLQEVPADASAARPDESSLRKNAEFLRTVLADFNIQGEIASIHPGPVVTLYELEPAPGTKTSRVISLSDDIARSMAAVSVRCAVVPGRNVIGIELPNKKRETVYMRELLSSRDVERSAAKLPLVLGKDIGGAPVIADLARMPHLLVAGTTGSGKSVAINTMILSLLYRLSPQQCRFIMIDPKMLELSVYDGIPHLLAPVVTEPGKAVVSLKWAVQEMEDRYRAMSKLGVRNIEGYNARLAEARRKGEVLMRKVQTGFDPDTGKPVYEEQPLDLTDLPYIVIVVDEFADLMLVAGKDVEGAVQRLAQMARAAGLHLIMATQRPSVDVITGVIKANFPTRISFQVTSKIDSRTILGEGGAEQLLGMGDMLYMAPGGRITRVHGPFVSDRDVQNVVDHLKAQAEPDYLEDITEGGFEGGGEVMSALFGGGEDGEGSGVDELYDQAVALVAREGKASTSFIQRYLQIGYNRAARIIEEMERQGVVSKANATGKRDVLIHDYSDV